MLASMAACGGGGAVAPPPPAVAVIMVTSPAGVVEAGGILQLTATARDAAGNALSDVAMSWATSAVAVATVDKDGRVRGIAAGSATISAAAGGRTATVSIAVRDTSVLPATLSGRIERVHLSIPSGTTHRIAADLVVLVDSVLDLAGTLEVDPGVSVALYARRTIIAGSIVGAPASGLFHSANGTAARSTSATAPSRLVLTQHGLTLRGTVENAGPVFLNGAGDGTTAPSTVSITGSLTIRPAPDGNSTVRDGQRGYELEIGTARGRGIADGIAPGWASATIGLVSVGPAGARLEAGAGGGGFDVRDRADGVEVGNTLEVTTGSGGEGGALTIEANTVDLRAFVSGGSGGPAGSIATVFLTGLPLRAGSGPGGDGEILLAMTGDGGRGGAVTIVAPTATGTVFAGRPGTPPLVLVTGGDGLAGGRGGLVQLDLGRPGSRGPLSVPAGVAVTAEPPASRDHGELRVTDGLNGAASTSAGKPGGEGGSVLVTRRGTPPPPPPPSPTINLRNVGNGGPGYNGCSSGAFGPGTDGGDGGTVDVGGEVAGLAGAYFNGGIGGSGFGVVGKGGGPGELAAGTTVTPVGLRGTDGADCTGTAIEVNPRSIAFTQINTASLPSPCVPTPAGTSQVRLRNLASVPVTLTMKITNTSGVSGMTFEPIQGNPASRTTEVVSTVPPLTTLGTTYHQDLCTATNNFQAAVTVTVTTTSAPVFVIPVTGTCPTNCKPGPVAPAVARRPQPTFGAAARPARAEPR